MRPEEKLFDAVTGIDEELVDSAQNYVFRKQTQPWQRVASLAACLLVMMSIGYGILLMGGVGGSDSASNGSAADNSATGDSAAPEDGGLSGGADDQESADAGGQQSAGEPVTFTATVLEVREGSLLVEPVEGDAMLATADRILVDTGGADLPDGVAEGAVVEITFDGMVRESYPAQISGVTEILLAGEQCPGRHRQRRGAPDAPRPGPLPAGKLISGWPAPGGLPWPGSPVPRGSGEPPARRRGDFPGIFCH